jgi:acetylornithine/N-succinyldiaminopimelate aminotransferase
MSKYLVPVYKRAGPIFVRGKGSFLWDRDGRKYLDLFPGWGVSILGHCHSRITTVIKEQAQQLIHLPNNLNQPWQEVLASQIVRNCFKAKVFFANSGTEAVEASIKFSRLYGRRDKRYQIITMRNSFHGRTFASLSATGQKKYKDCFAPLLPKFIQVKFNDYNDFKRRVNKKTVGVMLELIQGEGGVNVADFDYVNKVWQLCRRRNLLFIVDEVQTGMGRTSKLFCYQHFGIQPDIMILSKGLGAGYPISAMVVRADIADIMGPGSHASTFGGNPLASRVALEVFRVIKEEGILLNTRRMGNYLIQRLLGLKEKFKIIREVRGMGLMVGLELTCSAYPIFEQALKRRLIINATHQNVLRIMPALNIKREELDLGLEILQSVLSSLC